VEGEVVKSGARNFGGKYVPSVRYQYRWGAATFRGSRIAYASVFVPSKASLQPFLRMFQIGSTVAVRVDPRHPRRSVLRPGNRFQNLVELLTGLGFAAFASLRILRGF